MQQFFAGLDVGSTTVKTVVCPANDKRILFHKYVRHESHQAEAVFDSLREIKHELSILDENLRLFMTGSAGQRLAELLGARFVQKVAAVSFAVETSFPEMRSVIELGGQDAKMIFFQESGDGSRLKRIATMNDRCAGGTCVAIEKIAAKLRISFRDLGESRPLASIRIRVETMHYFLRHYRDRLQKPPAIRLGAQHREHSERLCTSPGTPEQGWPLS